MAKAKKLSWTELQELFQQIGGCDDEDCLGVGIATKVVPGGACPNPCQKRFLREVRNKARRDAKTNADNKCYGKSGDVHCQCFGRYAAGLPEQCCTMKDANGNNVCLYIAIYYYTGKCYNSLARGEM